MIRRHVVMQFGRTVLQLDKTVSADRNALGQIRGQLPGLRPVRINPAIVSR
jgi:hypothetical protein